MSRIWGERASRSLSPAINTTLALGDLNVSTHKTQILEVREMMDNQIKQELATRSSGFFEQRLSVARLAKADASSETQNGTALL